MGGSRKSANFAPQMTIKPFVFGALAQVVEHRTENPCVPGSNPGGTTSKNAEIERFSALFVFVLFFPHEANDNFY